MSIVMERKVFVLEGRVSALEAELRDMGERLTSLHKAPCTGAVLNVESASAHVPVMPIIKRRRGRPRKVPV